MKTLVGFYVCFAIVLAKEEISASRDAALFKEWLAEINQEPEPELMAPMVTIKNGTIKGRTSRSIGFHKIYNYLGIPFAKAPVGNLRFQAPQPHDGWGNTTLIATKKPKACAQHLTNFTKSDEDCLFLNIYSRREGGGAGPLLPVVVYIHGGGFFLGQSSGYEPYKLLANEVVLVTIQYRLGPLGFFYVEDDTVSGNNAMKDQVKALSWVRENIEAFGGQPQNITVMGESAGSASALYMLISPLAQNLFHGVIAMSGTPLQEWAIDRKPLESAKKLATTLNCTTETNAKLVACLRGLDYMSIVKAGVATIVENFSDFKILLAGSTPVIEGDVPGAFLPDDPLKLISQGPLPDVPVLLGSVQHEGNLPLAVAYYRNLQNDKERYLKNETYMREYFLGDLLATYGVDEKTDGASISQTLAAGFLKPGSDRANFEENMYEILDISSSVFMKAPVLRTANILSSRLSSVYLYSFEYYNQLGGSFYNYIVHLLIPLIGGDKPPMKSGICHADDLIYMFRFPFLLGPRDRKFSKAYCELFMNFVRYGTPTPDDVLSTSSYPNWPKYNAKTQRYMELAEQFTVKTDYSSSWRKGMKGVK